MNASNNEERPRLFDVFLVTNYFRFLILQKFSDFQNNTKEKYGHKAV